MTGPVFKTESGKRESRRRPKKSDTAVATGRGTISPDADLRTEPAMALLRYGFPAPAGAFGPNSFNLTGSSRSRRGR